jgi:hypothetical protein
VGLEEGGYGFEEGGRVPATGDEDDVWFGHS